MAPQAQPTPEPSAPSDPRTEAFIEKWAGSGGGERSNAQSFLIDLCGVLGVSPPGAASEREDRNAYVFERKVTVKHDADRVRPNFIDLYKRGCFVLEAKQSARKRTLDPVEQGVLSFAPAEARVGSGRRGGAQWDILMRNARQQAEMYAKHLPPEEGWPPFLVVVDVGHVIELYADFSLQGKHYAQFPDRQRYRIFLDDLRDPAVRDRLRRVWTEPESLNPARRTAQVTREIADLLARLSGSLERRLLAEVAPTDRSEAATRRRHDAAEAVAMFLMRCVFTMFVEDIGLLPKDSFTRLLEDYQADGRADHVHEGLRELWEKMDTGGFSTSLRRDVLYFNGRLFKQAEALPVTDDELGLLIIAARHDWKDVEPAIFGTLMERALNPRERHSLGAYYTPRAYVERLVVATMIDPLTEQWLGVQGGAADAQRNGNIKDARQTVAAFHRHLCDLKILDPACGTGNFLYVAMELLKRLEGEVLEALFDMGETQETLDLDQHTVGPRQFLGLEINPRAVAIAELVLWIGHLQWHVRTRGRATPTQPVVRSYGNIQERDAILDHDGAEIVRDDHGNPVTRWDGITHTLHPITGEMVPDETARVPLRRYKRPRPASWPQADFIIGNPPFIGGKDMRQDLGDGYAEACWAARKHIPGGADFVMHFWDKAAETVRLGQATRFGFITTNSITQTFSRRVIAHHLDARKPLSLVFAVPDHPWLKGADKAAVRIAMTVGQAGDRPGALRPVEAESGLDTDAPQVVLGGCLGKIWSDLTVGPNLGLAKALQANDGLCSPGVKLHGAGFIVDAVRARGLGLGTVPGLDDHILDYRNGRDLTGRARGFKVIDLYPLTESEVRQRFPAVYQHVRDRVKPERDQNNRASYRDNWWIFGEPRREFRPALKGLPRYIVTVETAKHRVFQFLDAAIRPDNKLIAFGLEDAFHLGVLSSRVHVAWALAQGGRLGVGNDPVYVKTRCFDTFPFPDAPAPLVARIRDLAEGLEAHRKAVLARHAHLTMTKLYNVLEAVRAGRALTAAEQDIYDAGQVGTLKSWHDDLDAAVLAAYGWPADLAEGDIPGRLVELNRARADEEAKGQVRWLRPAFQAPDAARRAPRAEQVEAVLDVAAGTARKPRFPTKLPDQAARVRALLADQSQPITADALSRSFAQGRRVEPRVSELLTTLTLLGQVARAGDGYVLNG